MKILNALTGLVASAVLAGVVSCGGDGDDAPRSRKRSACAVRSAPLTGAQENPPVVSSATGRGAVVVNPTTKEITGGMTFAGITPTTGGHHIHQAPAGSPFGL